jgi:hypothetical protein
MQPVRRALFVTTSTALVLGAAALPAQAKAPATHTITCTAASVNSAVAKGGTWTFSCSGTVKLTLTDLSVTGVLHGANASPGGDGKPGHPGGDGHAASDAYGGAVLIATAQIPRNSRCT